MSRGRFHGAELSAIAPTRLTMELIRRHLPEGRHPTFHDVRITSSRNVHAYISGPTVDALDQEDRFRELLRVFVVDSSFDKKGIPGASQLDLIFDAMETTICDGTLNGSRRADFKTKIRSFLDVTDQLIRHPQPDPIGSELTNILVDFASIVDDLDRYDMGNRFLSVQETVRYMTDIRMIRCRTVNLLRRTYGGNQSISV
ncbi:hypothetical protein F5X68DRAFT_280024 [Plectosphaerella plurivora]|uniref:Uncharacterized protein n=1 Tax=Plectosphaerella plurivora TaxID=936078 RepID=A0A9P8V091_9PEZI|nr:hypothetical protein F5X68DRAFT_280024 [Plectosphaerella plurivora]